MTRLTLLQLLFVPLIAFHAGAEPKLKPLASAEAALKHFQEVIVPRLAKHHAKDGLDPVTPVVRNAIELRCGMLAPNYLDNPLAYGIRWPEEGYTILAGATDKAKGSKKHMWLVDFSTGFGNELMAYLDFETGEPLLVFIIPGG